MEAKSEDYCGLLLLYVLQPHEFLQDRKNNHDYGSYSDSHYPCLSLSQLSCRMGFVYFDAVRHLDCTASSDKRLSRK